MYFIATCIVKKRCLWKVIQFECQQLEIFEDILLFLFSDKFFYYSRIIPYVWGFNSFYLVWLSCKCLLMESDPNINNLLYDMVEQLQHKMLDYSCCEFSDSSPNVQIWIKSNILASWLIYYSVFELLNSLLQLKYFARDRENFTFSTLI